MGRIPVLFPVLLVATGWAAGTAWGASYARTIEFTDATPGSEYIRAVATDSSGNFYLAGRDMGPKHWIRRINADGSPGWIRYAGDGFPEDIAGADEPYGAAVIAGRLIVVGYSNTAAGASLSGFVASMALNTGNVDGVSYFQETAGYGARFHAVSGDPSDGNLAWVAGLTQTPVEMDNGLLVKYNVSVAPAVPITTRTLDAAGSKNDDSWYAITVTPGAIQLGGSTGGGTPGPWWARYDKTPAYQNQNILAPPPGEATGAIVGLAMAAGRLYAAMTGGPSAFETLIARELDPSTGTLQTAQAALKTNTAPLASDVMYSCGLAVNPATGRILVADFDQVWELDSNLSVLDTRGLPPGWHVTSLACFGDGRFATAGWDQNGIKGTAAVWAPAVEAGGGSSATIALDSGGFKIAPNVIELSTGGWAGFHVRGDPGAAFTVMLYDVAGRQVGSFSGTCDGTGAGLVKFHGGNKNRDAGWTGELLAPGPYRAVAEGPGLDKKPRSFLIVIRRKS